MKLPTQLDVELQKARVLRSVAVFVELVTIFMVVWGIKESLEYVGALF